MKILILSLLMAVAASGVTREVVQVYQPLSFHFTDTAVERGAKGDLIQADVVARAMVLSGAFPEDLAKAVEMSCRLDTNNRDYDVEEANLTKLFNLTLDVSRQGETVEVIINCSEAKGPEDLEVGLATVLEMLVESIRRTLRTYYLDGGHESFQCNVTLSGLSEEDAELKKLAKSFTVGPVAGASPTPAGDVR